MSKKLLFFLLFVFALSNNVLIAQSKTISGAVVDVNGVPLPGVNVIEKGTTNGNTTDFDGNFTINVSASSVLIFSYVGYTSQEINVDSKSTINVILKESLEALDEIVVTALGIKREKKALGYSVQEVKGEALTVAANGNIASNLQGKVAGVNITTTGGVGGNARIDLRGASSLTGNDRLLWVIDGVPFADQEQADPEDLFGGISNGGTLLDINPDNIESMSVLKGGPAAALYGTRGANGVVLITTKSGKNSEGLGISYSGSTTFSEAAFFLNTQNQYGQGNNGVYNKQSGASWGPRYDGVEREAWTGELLPYQAAPNQLEDFTRTGVSIRNYVSFSNANDKGNYIVSVSKDNTEGIYQNFEIDKLNVDIKGAYEINPWLNVDAKASYIETKGNQRPDIGFYSYTTAFNTMPGNIRTQDLSPGFVVQNGERREILFGNSSNLTENPNANNRNPYFVQDQSINNDKRNRILGYTAATISFTDNLSLKLKYGLDAFRSQRNQGYRFKDNVSDQRPDFNTEESYFSETNGEFLLSYNTELNEDFKLSLSGGGNKMDRRSETLSARSGRIDDPNNFFLDAGTQITASKNVDEYSLQSLYAFGELSYKDMLYLSATTRNDWSSALPINANSFLYSSASLSGLISEMVEMPYWIDYLKVRGSWSEVGKDAPLELTNPVITIQPFSFDLLVSQLPQEGVSSSLKPEISTTSEIGIETRLFKNRLSIDFTYYNEQTRNQIVPVPGDESSGQERTVTNVGRVSNKGFEILTTITPVKTDDFNLDVTLNFARNVGVLEEFRTKEDDDEVYFLFRSTTIGEEVRATEGEKLGDIYGTILMRDDKGNPIVGDDGLPVRSQDKNKVGNIQADFTGSIGLNANYKGFYLNALLGVQQGGDIYSITEATATGSGNAARTVSLGREPFFVDGGIQADGSPNTTIVSPQEYWGSIAGITEEFIYDASYMKLNELAIGYNFPQSILKTVGNGVIRNARFSIIGRNLFYIYRNTPGTVPDAGVFNTTLGAQAFDFSPVPVSRTYGVSLNLNF